MYFEDALQLARPSGARAIIARRGKDHFYKCFADGLYLGMFATPDADLKPAKWIRCPSIVADDWYIVDQRRLAAPDEPAGEGNK